MKNKTFKKIFNRFSISHGYRSSFTINNFQNNLDYDSTNPYLRDDAGNFLVQTLYGNLNLVEQFNPLFKLDFELKNSFKFLAEFVKDRALSLSLDNNILTESFGEEFIFGLGYRIKDLSFRTNLGGRRTSLKGDLNFKADVSYRNNLTVLRNLDIENNSKVSDEILQPLYDDLNTPGYIANLHQLYDKAQKGNDEDKSLFVSACQFVGLLNESKENWLKFKISKALISEKEILQKIQERNKARENKNYEEADKIRKELLDKGVLIEDKDGKTTWKFK